MKKIIFAVLFITSFIMLSSYGLMPSHDNTTKSTNNIKQNNVDDEIINAVSRKIFESIKKKDYSKLQEVVINKSEILELLAKLKDTDEEKIRVKSNIDNLLKQSYSKIRSSFFNTIKNAEESGVVWEQCEYFDNEYQISKKGGNQKLELTIKFKFKDIEYSFSNTQLHKTSLGWKVMGEFQWERDLNYENMVDSTVVEVDTFKGR